MSYRFGTTIGKGGKEGAYAIGVATAGERREGQQRERISEQSDLIEALDQDSEGWSW